MIKKIVIAGIKFYQLFSRTVIQNNALPVLFVSQCRFHPSCSEYTLEAVAKYGVIRGSIRGLMRILRCNPLSPIS